MICQDCTKKGSEVLIFSMEKKDFFAVCFDCITDDDYTCSDSLLRKVLE